MSCHCLAVSLAPSLRSSTSRQKQQVPDFLLAFSNSSTSFAQPTPNVSFLEFLSEFKVLERCQSYTELKEEEEQEEFGGVVALFTSIPPSNINVNGGREGGIIIQRFHEAINFPPEIESSNSSLSHCLFFLTICQDYSLFKLMVTLLHAKLGIPCLSNFFLFCIPVNRGETDQDKLNSMWRQAFMKAYKAMDKELRSHLNLDCFCSGSTAVTIVKQGSNLFMSNIGDS
ncbi:hypothetical protein Ahy_B09g098616 [Arachis hypogaea]|uniref:PPM-type phosphatase domain-containing protein n=1 Tax=Arachis hypogaea TaxID=3818 RepID=A0A444XRM7_ARAHY|nr:hypothetical protein Ahy_B09g098616 [Arachis hypogaea]